MSDDEDSKEDLPRKFKSAVDFQRYKLEKLMKNPVSILKCISFPFILYYFT